MDNESKWRRDGPLPDFNQSDQAPKRQDKHYERNEAQDKTEKVSNWRRDGPLPESTQRKQSYRRPEHESEGKAHAKPPAVSESLDSWRKSGDSFTSTSKGHGMKKHERSSVSIKNVKASRTDDGNVDGNAIASVSTNNAFGCLSNVKFELY